MNGKPIKNINSELEQIFTSVLEDSHKEFDTQDLARVFIHHPSLNKAIIVAPQALGTLSPQLILDTVKATLQSNEELEVNADFNIHLGVVNMRAGSRENKIINVQRDRINKRSIVRINNDDEMCMARAIVTGVSRLKFQNTVDPDEKILRAKNAS